MNNHRSDCNIGIYIHIPFCIKKCPYCDFFSVSDLSLRHGFLKALLKELDLRAVSEKCVDTVYFGGGTPSLMSIRDIEKIMESVARNFNLKDDVQITMEVNPGTLTGLDMLKNNHLEINWDQHNGMAGKLKDIRGLGINRLSVGVQSFQDDKLNFLKRIHSARTAVETLCQARDAGFGEIGVDLMYGLPGETEISWQQDLEAALQFNPEHLSCYMLTYEPETPMFDLLQKGVITPLKEDHVATLFKQTSSYLSGHGFLHYEISNFASNAEYESRHNRKYWSMVPYLGFGPSAHSYDGCSRFWNHNDITKYINLLQGDQLPVKEQETLTLEHKVMEMLMLGLRTRQGVDIKAFEHLSECDFKEQFSGIIEKIESRSWGGICGTGKAGRVEGGDHGGTGKAGRAEEGDHGRFCLNLDGWGFMDTVTAWFVNKI